VPPGRQGPGFGGKRPPDSRVVQNLEGIMMAEQEKREEKYMPNRQLENYAAMMMRSKYPPMKKQQLVERYKTKLENEARAVAAARAFVDNRGIIRPSFRRLADTLARACGGCGRMSQDAMVDHLADRAAIRLRHGMDEALVFELMETCLRAVPNERGLQVFDRVRTEAKRLHAERSLVKTERAPAPMSDFAGKVPSVGLPEGIADSLESSNEHEEFQRQQAIETLKQALRCIKPGLRHVVVDRIARRKTLAEIATENGLSIEQLRQLLEQARVVVRRFTNYFDDEFLWFGERAQTV